MSQPEAGPLSAPPPPGRAVRGSPDTRSPPRACPHFGVCTKCNTGRSLSIPLHEELIAANRERVHLPELRPLPQVRGQRGEAPFGYFNHLGGLRRLAGRGLSDATKKTLIAAVGWNRLRRLSPGAAEPA